MNDPQDIVGRVATLMSECAVAPSPANYEFFYRYATGADARLVEMADAMRAHAGGLSQPAINAIRRELYGSGGGMGRVIEGTERELARVSGYVARSDAGARRYRDVLDRHPIDARDTLERQRAMVGEILDATARMIAQQEALRDELAHSASEIDRLKAELEIARVESRSDTLTGLSNRKACADCLDAQIGLALAEGTPLSLVFIDIDHFKSFNDNHGHGVGDEVLRLVSRGLERAFHGHGFVGRWGGEEFVVVMPRCGAADAADAADGFRRLIASRTIRSRQSGEPVGRLTLSLGVAELRAGDCAQTLVERADRALYDAKAEGRDRVVTFRDPDGTDDDCRSAAA